MTAAPSASVARPIPGPSPAASTPAAQPAQTLAEPTSTDLPWSLARASWRVFLGSFIGVIFQFFWLLLANRWIATDTSALETASLDFGATAWLMAIIATVVIAIGENRVSQVRLPTGAAYRFVGNNRWAATAILGALTGLAIGLLVEAVIFGERFGLFDGAKGEIVYTAIAGFLIAEAIVGRRFRPKSEAASPA